jgi:excisionase family DNA binding protein
MTRQVSTNDDQASPVSRKPVDVKAETLPFQEPIPEPRRNRQKVKRLPSIWNRGVPDGKSAAPDQLNRAIGEKMSEMDGLSFDRLLEKLAEKLATRLSQEPSRLYPRLLTIDQAAIYVGRTREATQHLAASGKIPTVRTDRRVFIDRLDLDRWIEEHKDHSN